MANKIFTKLGDFFYNLSGEPKPLSWTEYEETSGSTQEVNGEKVNIQAVSYNEAYS